MRKVVIGAIVLATIGLGIVLFPFGRPSPKLDAPTGSFAVVSSRCSPPVLSAWRTEHADTGWFGYAPLTSTPVIMSSCKPPAGRRLAVGSTLIIAGLVGVVVGVRRHRRDGPAETIG